LKRLYFRYLAFLGLHQGSLQPLCAPKNAWKPHATKSLNYNLGLQDLRAVITAAGFDGSQFAEHSGKRGGATHAASAGLEENEIQDIGHRKNVKTARLYIDNNTPMRQKRTLKLQKLM